MHKDFLNDFCYTMMHVEKTGVAKSKMELLTALKGRHEEDFKTVLNRLFNPYIVFNTTWDNPLDNEEVSSDTTVSDDGGIFAEILDILEDLSNRSIKPIVGNQLILDQVKKLPKLHKKYILRFLNRHMRNGFTASSVPKLYKGLLPEFGCQLASTYKKYNPKKKYFVDTKMDGLRCVFLLDPENPVALSRLGLPLPNLQSFAQALVKSFPNQMIDSEVFAGSWNNSIRSAKKTGADTSQMHPWVFDMMPLEDFKAGKCKTGNLQRRKNLEDNRETFEKLGCKLTVMQEIKSEKEMNVFAKQAFNDGFEGAILKECDAPYILKRTTAWQKAIFKQRGDYKIVGIKEGIKKQQGSCGAIQVEVNDINSGVICGVGTGLNDEKRKYFWDNKEEVIGTVIEVEFREYTDDGSLRFPVFIRLRPDKEA